MKPELTVGKTEELEILVTPDMVAKFGDTTVHKLYATSALVHHMEWAARKILEPYLEEHEEGMGYHAEVSHLMPTIPGMKVKLKATVSDIRDRKVVCDIEAFNPRGKIARGTVTQAIVEKSWLDNKIKEMTLVHQLAIEAKSTK
jgi:predicted thioesterase